MEIPVIKQNDSIYAAIKGETALTSVIAHFHHKAEMHLLSIVYWMTTGHSDLPFGICCLSEAAMRSNKGYFSVH